MMAILSCYYAKQLIKNTERADHSELLKFVVDIYMETVKNVNHYWDVQILAEVNTSNRTPERIRSPPEYTLSNKMALQVKSEKKIKKNWWGVWIPSF